ncbi:MAG: TRAP transporter small permease subunit [Candidatus Accumulibacter sp.]|jgi:TRAP-type C4-dicarboxylate transport system permease small subunit|nr:TRAP transporter small permease subunit [Accumulibacter sp.]
MKAVETSRTAHERSTAIRFLDGVDRLIGFVCKSVVLSTGVALLLAIIIGVIARYLIRVGGIDWAEELPKQLFSWFIMAGVVLALQYGNHIAVELIFNFLPAAGRRVLIVLTNLLLCGAYLYLCVVAADVAKIASAEINPMLGTPNSIPFYALTCGSLLTAASALSIAIRVFLLGDEARPRGAAEESVV